MDIFIAPCFCHCKKYALLRRYALINADEKLLEKLNYQILVDEWIVNIALFLISAREYFVSMLHAH